MKTMYGGAEGGAVTYPQWAVDALKAVGVDLTVDV